MDLLIVSGLSGAGKSVAMNALEDIGFFCIDNVPAELLPSITAFSKAGDNQLKRVALSMDVRGCHTSEQIEQALHQLDEEVVDFVMGHPEAKELLRRYEGFLEYALPLYVKEGKSQLTIAVGCTGGKHRSITFARKIAEYCKQLGYQTGIQHRDAAR